MSARIPSLEAEAMILYRARTIASRPRRHREFEGNQPESRIKGRWFTSDIHAAVSHRDGLLEDSEIIAIEMDDAVAETFRVGVTPYTRCGLSPIEHSASPLNDYVLPMFFIMDPIEVDIAGNARRRDVIDVNASKLPPVRRIVIDLDAITELPLAA